MPTPKIKPATDDPIIVSILAHPTKRKVEKKAATKRRPIWAVDFDGTLCKNWWPKIGPENTELIEVLKFAKQQGVKLILWTCRENEMLAEAVGWCSERGLEFDAINNNPPEAVANWECNPRKVGADLYIDDKAFNPSGGQLCELLSAMM